MKKLKLLFTLCLIAAVQTVFAAPDMTPWSAYSDSLKNCTPGTFNLPDPIGSAVGSPTITFQIVGMNAGACQVNITKTITMPNQPQPTSIVLNCSFTSANIAVLTKAAKDLSSGTLQMSSDDPASKIMESACKQG